MATFPKEWLGVRLADKTAGIPGAVYEVLEPTDHLGRVWLRNINTEETFYLAAVLCVPVNDATKAALKRPSLSEQDKDHLADVLVMEALTYAGRRLYPTFAF